MLTNDVSIARMMATIPHPFEFADALALIGEYMIWHGRVPAPALPSSSRAGDIPARRYQLQLHGTACRHGVLAGAKHRGRGYAEEAVRAVIEMVMSRSDIGYITAGAYHDNLESIGLQTRIGFIRTGVSKRLNRFRGEPTDHVDMVYFRDRSPA